MLTIQDCRAAVERLFRRGPGFGIAAEIELLTRLADGSRPSVSLLSDALAGLDLPGGSKWTLEPGSQVELASAPYDSVSKVVDAIDCDTARLVSALKDAGVVAWIGAVDTSRPPQRTETHPRYRWMESRFDEYSGAGRWMMNNSASIQVNINNFEEDPLLQWQMFWKVGPILNAIFANSNGVDAEGHRWESLRQAFWLALDRKRTGPVDVQRGIDGYLQFALDAPLLLIKDVRGDETQWSEPVRDAAVGIPTFRNWIGEPDRVGRAPNADDFKYHLSTLFPDIRPRGWMEIRTLDMVEMEQIEVVLTLVAAISNPHAAQQILSDDPAVAIPDITMCAAARKGLRSASIQRAADRLFEIAMGSIDLVPGGRLESLVEFYERFTKRGLSPGTVGCGGAQRLRPDLSAACVASH